MGTYKTVAITGSTGGLGQRICARLIEKGCDLILVDRNLKKSTALADALKKIEPKAQIRLVTCDLTDVESVKAAAKSLCEMGAEALILNSGIYNVPLEKCCQGYNNVFTVNFISQYYLARYLSENSQSLKKVIAMSSIAHRYGTFDQTDVDFSTRKKASLIYGNSKRVLTFALYEFFARRKAVKLCVAHPGVTLTNMTNHYPKLINPIVKLGIKLIFPKPEKAIESVIMALDSECGYGEWIGPKVFDVWGAPVLSKIKVNKEEAEKIAALADSVYASINE